MNAEEYLKVALGGNMNISTLKPAAWHDIMTDFAKHYHKELSKSVLPDVSKCYSEKDMDNAYDKGFKDGNQRDRE